MKKYLLIIIVAAITAGAGFYGGTVYSKSVSASSASGRYAAMQGGLGQNAAARRSGSSAGGFTGVTITASDATSITVKTTDGGSKIVLVSGSTNITKSASGLLADLSVGKNVVITGTANSDGSVTAQSIQLRPDMPPSTTKAQ